MAVELIKQFERKHNVRLHEVVDTHAGQLFRFDDLYGFYLHEIKYDLDTAQPVGRIKAWADQQIDDSIEGIMPPIHYQDYCKNADKK
jgi:hypothetical protein